MSLEHFQAHFLSFFTKAPVSLRKLSVEDLKRYERLAKGHTDEVDRIEKVKGEHLKRLV